MFFVDEAVYKVVTIGETVGVALVVAVKVESAGLAVQVYPVEPPLTDKVVGLPRQMITSLLVVNAAPVPMIILNMLTVVPALSVTDKL